MLGIQKLGDLLLRPLQLHLKFVLFIVGKLKLSLGHQLVAQQVFNLFFKSLAFLFHQRFIGKLSFQGLVLSDLCLKLGL